MSESSVPGRRDEVLPEGGGIFRRMAPSSGSALAGAFSALESVFAPAASQAREELARQKRAGARDPSDTDPPDDDEAGPPPRVVSAGRPGTPFSGQVRLRHPPPTPR